MNTQQHPHDHLGPWPYGRHDQVAFFHSTPLGEEADKKDGSPGRIAKALFDFKWEESPVRTVLMKRHDVDDQTITIIVRGGQCWKVSEIIHAATAKSGGLYELEWFA